MSKRYGVSRPVSIFRRILVDLMHYSSKVPSVTIERRMNLGPLVAARQARQPRPSWSAIFTKAFAVVAARRPELRTSYMKFPWPRFYEHPTNIVALNVDRALDNERVVIYALISRPENRPLEEIDEIVRHHKEDPIERVRAHVRTLRMGKLWWPLRRFMWWGSLNFFGRRRCHNFGTFGITSLGALGTAVHKIIPLLTSTLHFGLFDESGNIDMRLSFDHRVYDGYAAAHVLADMETVLLTEILEELQSPPLKSVA